MNMLAKIISVQDNGILKQCFLNLKHLRDSPSISAKFNWCKEVEILFDVIVE